MAASIAVKPLVKLARLWLPVLICMGAIFFASSLPGSDLPELFIYQDIVAHLFAYAVLAYFFARSLKNTSRNISSLSLFIFTVSFGIIYGASDELHQVFTPCRNMSGLDVFVDGIGSILGSILYK